MRYKEGEEVVDSDISVRSRFGDASDLLLPLFSLSVIVHRDFVIFRSGSVIELRERGGGGRLFGWALVELRWRS